MLSLRLKNDLRFEPEQIGLVYASSALGAIFASLIAGQVADRWLSTERCLAICSSAMGGLLLALSFASEFWLVCGLCLGIWLFMVPNMILGVTMTMTHLQHPEQQYSRVRLWGTIGWVTSGLLLGLWLSQPEWLQLVSTEMGYEKASVVDSQRLAALLAFCLAGYSWTLPNTPPSRQARSWLAPLQALHLMRQGNFAVFCLCGFLLHATIPFHMQLTALLLENLGVAKELISPSLTIAQWSEILILWMLPALSSQLGMKGTLLIGLVSLVMVMTILMIGQPTWLVITSLSLFGFVICCYIIRGQVFINKIAGQDIRASAQGLFTTLNGFGLLTGNLLCGGVHQYFESQFALTFGVGACVALLATFLLAFGFQNETQTQETSPTAKVPRNVVPVPDPSPLSAAEVPQPVERIPEEPAPHNFESTCKQVT